VKPPTGVKVTAPLTGSTVQVPSPGSVKEVTSPLASVTTPVAVPLGTKLTVAGTTVSPVVSLPVTAIGALVCNLLCHL